MPVCNGYLYESCGEFDRILHDVRRSTVYQKVDFLIARPEEEDGTMAIAETVQPEEGAAMTRENVEAY